MSIDDMMKELSGKTLGHLKGYVHQETQQAVVVMDLRDPHQIKLYQAIQAYSQVVNTQQKREY